MRALIVLTTLLLGGSVAHADDAAMAHAREIAARGQAHYDRGEYDAAIVDFREAYDLVHTPGLLYNLGQAYRLNGDCVNAATMYRHYLLVARSTQYQNVVERHLMSLDTCVRERLGGTLLTAVPERPGRRSKRAGLMIGGAGLAVAGVGTAIAIDAMRSSNEREVARLDMAGKDDSDKDPLAQPGDGDRDVTFATALIAGGLVATAAGATLYYFGWRDEKNAAILSVGPVNKGATASLAWSF
jgi:tetratricopeptide (TPR) repeat protein